MQFAMQREWIKSNFEEGSVRATQAAEWVQCLYHPRSPRPSGACSTCKREYACCAAPQRLSPNLTELGRQTFSGIQVLTQVRIFQQGGMGQRILRQPQASRLQLGSNMFMLNAIEPVLFQQLFECSGSLFAIGLLSRKQMLNQSSGHPRELRPSLCGGPQRTELGPLWRRKDSELLAEESGNTKPLIRWWKQTIRAAHKLCDGPVFIDFEVISHRLHSERY